MSVLSVVALAGCGRLGYDSLDASSSNDVAAIDDGPQGVADCTGTVHFTDAFDDGAAGPLFMNGGMTVAEQTGTMDVTYPSNIAADNWAWYTNAADRPCDRTCATLHVAQAATNGGAIYLKLVTPSREVELFHGGGTIGHIRTRLNNTVETRIELELDPASRPHWEFEPTPAARPGLPRRTA